MESELWAYTGDEAVFGHFTGSSQIERMNK